MVNTQHIIHLNITLLQYNKVDVVNCKNTITLTEVSQPVQQLKESTALVTYLFLSSQSLLQSFDITLEPRRGQNTFVCPVRKETERTLANHHIDSVTILERRFCDYIKIRQVHFGRKFAERMLKSPSCSPKQILYDGYF